MSTLSWGASGDEVVKLQETLTHLGHYTGAIDGRFGPLTRNAVLSFQRAAGLVADGIVGPATWAALAAEPAPGSGGPGGGGGTPGNGGPPGGTPASTSAISLHIGLNRVDPAKYGGWNGALGGCENDARAMTAIAASDGFTTRQLFSAAATTVAVLGAIRDAAQQLTAGGRFLLTYAGHGGQVPNTSGDEETDKQDETWVLYDRQLIDDEIEQALAGFAPGVGVVMISDSCHSGTVYREMPDPIQREIVELKQAFYSDLAMTRSLSLFTPRPRASLRSGPRSGLPAARPRSAGARYPGQVAVLEREAEPESDTVNTREMPFDVNLEANEIQAGELRAAKESLSRAVVRADGLLISGCADSQLSQESGGHGVFTSALERTWANGAFTGSYVTFHKQILSQMGPNQTPQLSLFGADPQALAARKPFHA